MNEERMLKPALIGGVLLGILSSLPVIGLFNCFCCAWVIGGGLLAAHLYVKDSSVPVTLGRGATLGLITGCIGSIVFALFSIPLYMMKGRSGEGFVEQLRRQMEQMPNMPPESREMLRGFLSRGDIGILLVVFGLVFVLVLYCLFAMLGGTIGVALFEKRKMGAPPPTDASQYQPPINLPPPPPPYTP